MSAPIGRVATLPCPVEFQLRSSEAPQSGFVPVPVGLRLSDVVNDNRQFLMIHSGDGDGFVMFNKTELAWLRPKHQHPQRVYG